LGEGFKRFWSSRIKMDEAVKAKVRNFSARSSRHEEAQTRLAENPKGSNADAAHPFPPARLTLATTPLASFPCSIPHCSFGGFCNDAAFPE